MNLENKDIGYILSPSKINGISSYLYSRGYKILEIKEYHKGKFQDSIIAWTIDKSQNIKEESLEIIKHFNQDQLIIKEINKSDIKKIFKDGSEKHLDFHMYSTNSEIKSYIHEGISFSFPEKQSYKFPKRKEDFKTGMTVECYSSSGWVPKIVDNIDTEYDKLYKTLSKYNKVRILI